MKIDTIRKRLSRAELGQAVGPFDVELSDIQIDPTMQVRDRLDNGNLHRLRSAYRAGSDHSHVAVANDIDTAAYQRRRDPLRPCSQRPGRSGPLRPRDRIDLPARVRPEHIAMRFPGWAVRGHFRRIERRSGEFPQALRGVVNNLVLKNSLRIGFGSEISEPGAQLVVNGDFTFSSASFSI